MPYIPSVVSICERQLCSWAPPNPWTLVYSSQNNSLRCPELWGHPAKSMCGKEDRATWGPSERWAEVVQSPARSGSVVSKPLWLQGPGGSLGGVRPSPAICRALCCCDQTRKRQEAWETEPETHINSTTMLTVSTFATEKPGPLAKREPSSLDLWCRGKEARNIFRAFKTLIVLHILAKGKNKNAPGIKKKISF